MCLIPQRIAIAAQQDGWYVRSDIIWAKPNPMPESCRDRPTDAYEHILMLTKSARYYWDAEAVKEQGQPESESRYRYEFKGPNEAKHEQMPSGKDTTFTPGMWEYHNTRNLRNVWTFSTQPYKGSHFATFPAELVIRCLLAATKPGDMVIDPFSGSGTVGEVAFNLGRRFLLMDLAYQNLQRQRIPPMALLGNFVSKAGA